MAGIWLVLAADGWAARPVAQAGMGLAALDSTTMFNDVAYGKPIGEIKDLEYVDNDEDIKYYRHPKDKLKFEGVKLDAVFYGFDDTETAVRVQILVQGTKAQARLLEALRARYGPGALREGGYSWDGSIMMLRFARYPDSVGVAIFRMTEEGRNLRESAHAVPESAQPPARPAGSGFLPKLDGLARIRGIALGSTVATMSDFVLVKSMEDGHTYYRKMDAEPRFSGITLKDMHYGFNAAGQLTDVVLMVPRQSARMMLDQLHGRYGPYPKPTKWKVWKAKPIVRRPVYGFADNSTEIQTLQRWEGDSTILEFSRPMDGEATVVYSLKAGR